MNHHQTGLAATAKISANHAATAPQQEPMSEPESGSLCSHPESGNAHAGTVAQQDATEPWAPWPWIVLGLVFCLGVDFGVFLGLWQAMRRVLC
jgi:hypothetical protein